MGSLLFLGLGAGIMLVAAIKNSVQVRGVLNKHSRKIRYMPQAISMLVLTAQVSELVRVLEQVSIVKIVAALFLLAIVAAGTSGTESQPR